MRCYWDSSGLLNALASRQVTDRLQADEHWTRSHGFGKVFSHLSGRGLPMKDGTRHRVSAYDAARMIGSLAARFFIRDHTAMEIPETLVPLLALTAHAHLWARGYDGTFSQRPVYYVRLTLEG